MSRDELWWGDWIEGYDGCEMCGAQKATKVRLYKYDNGEEFKANVCNKCADLHGKLVKK